MVTINNQLKSVAMSVYFFTFLLCIMLADIEAHKEAFRLRHTPKGKNEDCECGADFNGLVTCKGEFVLICSCGLWNMRYAASRIYLFMRL